MISTSEIAHGHVFLHIEIKIVVVANVCNVQLFPFSWTIFLQLYREVPSDKMYPRVKEALESSHQDDLKKVIELAWKFVTIPNPLIVCQPKKFDPKIHDQEAVHWDKQANECELVYIRPVVYRNYEGVVARKGWVANTAPSQQGTSKCFVNQFCNNYKHKCVFDSSCDDICSQCVFSFGQINPRCVFAVYT